jgi:YVTN family beta-propeller protein
MRLLSLAIGSLVLVGSAHDALTGATPPQGAAAAVAALDYESFKTQVQPIFLARREGHARCYACHALGAGEGNAPNAMRLQPLSTGSTTWNEEQSRKNFEAVRQKVVPGNPKASRLLIHPLRYEAGGDQGHGGGAQFSSANEPEWQVIAAWVMGDKALAEKIAASSHSAGSTRTPVPPVPAAGQGLKVRIIQTNMAGDNLHIIDPATNRVVAEITGIEANHGVAAAPDGSRLYVTNEADRTVDVVDTKTLHVSKKIPLSGPPNNISIQQGWTTGISGYSRAARRSRRHRHGHADQCQAAPPGRHADPQHLCDAGRQVRHRCLGRSELYRRHHRSED